MAEKRPGRERGPLDLVFWDWCAKGELRLQQCGKCAGYTWPVAESCEHCGHGEMDWAAMSGRGRLVSWCAFHQDYYQGLLPVPYDCILVELDEGPLFLSNPKGFGWDRFADGLEVKLAFISCEDDGGAFSLPVFETA